MLLAFLLIFIIFEFADLKFSSKNKELTRDHLTRVLVSPLNTDFLQCSKVLIKEFFFTSPRNRGGVIFSLQFVSVCVRVSIRLFVC